MRAHRDALAVLDESTNSLSACGADGKAAICAGRAEGSPGGGRTPRRRALRTRPSACGARNLSIPPRWPPARSTRSWTDDARCPAEGTDLDADGRRGRRARKHLILWTTAEYGAAVGRSISSGRWPALLVCVLHFGS